MSNSEIQRHVVGTILVNERGEVLLQQRDNKPDLRYPGYWTFFGGAVEDGETPDEAVRRELIEELELDDITLEHWQSYTCPARTIPGEVKTTNHMYIGTLTRPIESLTLHEGQGMAYFNREQSAKLELAFEQSPVLAAYFAEFAG